MKRTFFVPQLSAIAVILASLLPAYAAEVAVTRDGQPLAVVVLSESLKPSDYSAKTLISHVKQMSGATLPTIKESELKGAKVENGRLIVPEGKTKAQTFILLGDGELT